MKKRIKMYVIVPISEIFKKLIILMERIRTKWNCMDWFQKKCSFNHKLGTLIHRKSYLAIIWHIYSLTTKAFFSFSLMILCSDNIRSMEIHFLSVQHTWTELNCNSQLITSNFPDHVRYTKNWYPYFN